MRHDGVETMFHIMTQAHGHGTQAAHIQSKVGQKAEALEAHPKDCGEMRAQEGMKGELVQRAPRIDSLAKVHSRKQR